jgi:hypothetical protein
MNLIEGWLIQILIILRIFANHCESWESHEQKIFFLYIGNHLESHANLCESFHILVIFEKFACMSYPSNLIFKIKKKNANQDCFEERNYHLVAICRPKDL